MDTQKEYALQMANTIWKTLFWSLKPHEVLSWGVRKRIATYWNNKHALEIHVNGMLHKGPVVIAYEEGEDLYEVYLLDNNRVSTQSMKHIYADELGSRIDEIVERTKDIKDEEYKTKAFSELLKAI